MASPCLHLHCLRMVTQQSVHTPMSPSPVLPLKLLVWEETTVVLPYFLTATITNHSESRADFISTLEVAVDEIDNGTKLISHV